MAAPIRSTRYFAADAHGKIYWSISAIICGRVAACGAQDITKTVNNASVSKNSIEFHEEPPK
jgi:hypothetical protein